MSITNKWKCCIKGVYMTCILSKLFSTVKIVLVDDKCNIDDCEKKKTYNSYIKIVCLFERRFNKPSSIPKT